MATLTVLYGDGNVFTDSTVKDGKVGDCLESIRYSDLEEQIFDRSSFDLGYPLMTVEESSGETHIVFHEGEIGEFIRGIKVW